MRYRQLGRSGLTVSVVALGCNAFGLNLDQDQSGALVHAALEAGVTLFDTAPNYGSEPGASERFLGAENFLFHPFPLAAVEIEKPLFRTCGRLRLNRLHCRLGFFPTSATDSA